MKYRLVKAKRGNGNEVILVARGEDLKKHIFVVKNFLPYYYVKDEKGQYVSIFGERLRKIIKRTPDEVKAEREKYSKHYEADIIFSRRFLIDKGIHSGFVVNKEGSEIRHEDIIPADVSIPLRYIFIDIEVGAEGITEITPKNPTFPIIALSIYDSYSEKIVQLTFHKDSSQFVKKVDENIYWMNFKSEFDLLYNFVKIFLQIDPDLILGWNIGFDIDYLLARLRRLGIELEISGSVFDYLEAYKRLFRRQSYHLNSVVNEEKISDEWLDFGDVYKVYKEGNIELMHHYNLNHVKWLVEIERKHKLIDFFLNLKEFAGLEDIDRISLSVIVDTSLLRLAREKNIVLPSVGNVPAERGYKGGYVFDPKAGIYSNVGVFDMSRYYPSIIVSFNLSPETKRKDNKGDIKITDNLSFVSQPTGLLPELCLRFFVERDRIQKEMKKYEPGSEKYNDLFLKSQTVKYATNAIYGYLAFTVEDEQGSVVAGSRLYDIDIPKAITFLAREGIIHLANFLKESGMEVIYGDTDSIMVAGIKSVEDAKKLEELMNEQIEKFFMEKHGVKECKVKIKFSQLYERVLLTDVKKRYMAKVIWDGEPCNYTKITGFEAVRTDQSRITVELQKEVAEAIVNGKDKSEIVKMVKEKISNLKNCPLKDIAIRKGIDMPFSSYKVLPPHVRGALYANSYLGGKIKPGDKVLMVWVKRIRGFPPTDVVCFTDEMKIDESIVEVDWERMKTLLFRQKLESILNVLGISWEEIEGAENLRKWL
ncbi:MAG: DNA polymerase domain-containing protein, partial [Caldisericaceae bacterium]